MLLGFSVLAALATQSVSIAETDTTAKFGRQPVSSTELAQGLPNQHNKTAPLDPRAAFIEGYRAYERHDLNTTISRMRFAATRLPDLADYALFYLASAERDNGNSQSAVSDFSLLSISYPQSVWSTNASVDYADLELKLGHPDYALAAATRVVDATSDPVMEQKARLTMAYALVATNSWQAAYNQAQIIRQKFPQGSADQPARELAYAMLRSHPQVTSAPPLEYHRTEAALLLHEGQDKAALAQIRAAMALQPPRPIRVELTWLSAEASRGRADEMKVALQLYLELAPLGLEAPRALNGLAHLYWHENDTETARFYFRRLSQEFPHDELAPTAMFEMGRTYEDEGNLQSARVAYLNLARRYPRTEAADDARFRAAFMLYMLGGYPQAVAEFSASGAHAATSSGRDMFKYWQARALENSGERIKSQRLFETLALSTSSNYYPALAAMRLNQAAPVITAPYAADLSSTVVPTVGGPLQFHLTRVSALRDLGLRELETPELRAVESYIGANRELQRFVLAELQNAGAWFDAIQMAVRMAARGEIDRSTAERIRYPRGFWDLIAAAADHHRLDPYLVTALVRQESLFNPQARSISDARGLMQLLPSTANRYAVDAGINGSAVDLYDPNVSIQLGTIYLHDLMGMFGGDIFKVVAAYNAGEHSVFQWNARYPGDNDQWVENIGFRETRDYVKKVIGGMREYHQLYGSPSAVSASIRTQ